MAKSHTQTYVKSQLKGLVLKNGVLNKGHNHLTIN